MAQRALDVDITDFFKSSAGEEELNLPLMEKNKIIDTLGKEEKNTLLKMIDITIANKTYEG